MKIKNILFLIIFLLFNHFLIKLHAQVTIGSGIPSNKGSLLDLKEYISNPSTGVNATRGLGMPRVLLVDPKSLVPTSVDTETEKANNIGLMVYNVANTIKFCPGLHVWDGTTWLSLKSTTDISPVALTQPNSYILAPGASIDIPVSKAYAAWLKLAELGNIDISNPAAVGGSAAISVELLWQTSNGIITSVALANGDQGASSSIRVVSGSGEGNAVVVIKIGGIVRWSWHIWVTNYDTTLPTNQNTLGETVFMSRNLGAISDVTNSIGNRGLYYQWGRKDPIPGTTAINSNTMATIYNISGVIVPRPGTTTNNTLLTMVQNPLIVATIGWTGSNASAPGMSWGDGCAQPKSIYDPCPDGWRVPHEQVWTGLTLANFTWDATNLGRQSTSTAGWYPATGNTTGTFSSVGATGYYWTAKPSGGNISSSAFTFTNTGLNVPPNVNASRHVGSSVRCVKDWMR